MKKTALTLLTACVGGMIAVGAYKVFESKQEQTIEDKQNVKFVGFNEKSSMVGSAGDVDFTGAAAMVTPAVVHIKTTYTSTNRGQQYNPFGDMFDDFFGGGGGRGRSRQPQRASGSGVIVTQDGYIVTNNHVVENADEIQVVLNDKRSFKGKLIGADPNTDLALVKIDGKDLPFVKYGNSDAVKVGEWVLAVGNPFNLTSTVTAGIISAKARNIGILGDRNDPDSRPIEAFIQTDAAINPGNSGGALVNTNGELIGVNAAIASQTGAYEGYGFAIPVNLVKKVINDILNFGAVQRGYLGVSFTENNADFAKEKGLKTIDGVYVQEVLEGGAAAAAGVKQGDLITKIEGANIRSGSDLQEQIGLHRPGDAVNLTVLRGGAEKSIKVVLKNSENTASLVKSTSNATFDALGGRFSPLNDAEKKKYKVQGGVKITGLKENGILAQSDIQQGFVITRVNGKVVSSEEEVKSALNGSRNGMVNIEGIYPDEPSSRYSFSFPAAK
ncbi:Do family serine endopeptidase [Solitalea canadensis]|uniref:Periplasmic serine protease, Do/DeqQ family n=1 Tax=Solitalea canadensis (strain ATCC 29591 / DSM 3403 / JCM 21819 / LMG 8368 / NBRC 15130 / NCIMB 12057 / USAM 9D) TaxID=929556 RepID=H8KMH4_SOLCM|nr:Do family serine endopeptidase [Solitalea canadensis]AFD08769.1 periplasmic serine protease, Do/DeqQ family [Solitalea canadensis DSM 3403]